MTKRERNRAAALRERGYTYREIGESLGVSATTARRCVLADRALRDVAPRANDSNAHEFGGRKALIENVDLGPIPDPEYCPTSLPWGALICSFLLLLGATGGLALVWHFRGLYP